MCNSKHYMLHSITARNSFRYRLLAEYKRHLGCKLKCLAPLIQPGSNSGKTCLVLGLESESSLREMALLWGAALPCTGDIPRTASIHFGGTLMPFLILLTLIRIGHVVSRARPSGFTDRQCDARGFLVLVSRR